MLAVTLWFLVTLNTQTYSSSIEYPIKLINVPREYLLVSEFPNKVNVQARGPGIELLGEHLDGKDTIVVDFLTDVRGNYFVAKQHISLFSKVFPSGTRVERVNPDSIAVRYVRKTTKRVPVHLRAPLPLATGLKLTRPAEIEPDSVLVIGPREKLEELTYWPISHVEIDPIEEPGEIFLSLDTLAGMESVQKSVKVKVDPQPYTEDSRVVEIRTWSPQGTRIRLSPPQVTVHYLVPMSRFEEIRERDFMLVVDSGSIRSHSDFVLPRLELSPEDVQVISIEPRKVKYTLVISE